MDAIFTSLLFSIYLKHGFALNMDNSRKIGLKVVSFFTQCSNNVCFQGIDIEDLGYTTEALFLVMMDAFSQMPIPQFFLILFFSMLLSLGLSTLFFQLNLVISAIQAFMPKTTEQILDLSLKICLGLGINHLT